MDATREKEIAMGSGIIDTINWALEDAINIARSNGNENPSPEDVLKIMGKKNMVAWSDTIRAMMVKRQNTFYWKYLSRVRIRPVVNHSLGHIVSIVYNPDINDIEVCLSPIFWKVDILGRERAIIHEVLHSALGHHERVKKLRDQKVASVAADIAVTSFFLQEEIAVLTEEGCDLSPDHPMDFGFTSGHTLEQYYDRLEDQDQQGQEPKQGDSDSGQRDGSEDSGDGEDNKGEGGNDEEEDAGRDEEQDGDDEGDSSESQESSQDQGSGGATGPGIEDFMSGKGPKRMEPTLHPWQIPPEELPHINGIGNNSNIEDAVKNARLEEASSAFGTMPDSIVEQIRAANTFKSSGRYWLVTLQTKLYDDTRIGGRWRLSYKRANRREESDELPGRRRKSMPLVAVAIDTSGSMSHEVLQEIVDALPHLDRQVRIGHCIQCDVKIHVCERYNPKTLDKIHGRGGTSFEEPLMWATHSVDGMKYDYMFYFTDGYGMFPNESDLRDDLKVVWVVTSDNLDFPFGQVIRMTDKHGIPIQDVW